MKAFTVRDVFKIVRFTDAPCILLLTVVMYVKLSVVEKCARGDSANS